MCVCVHACVCACVHVCVLKRHVCECVHTCMCMCICMCVCMCMCMCLYAYVCDATAGVIIRILVWSGKCHSKQEVGWSSADIDQLFYITCTLEVRSYVNSTSMEATNQLLAS